MANIKYAYGRPWASAQALAGDFIVPSSITGSTPQTNYALADVRDEHINRPVRFDHGTNRTITFVIASQIPSAIFVEGINVSRITITSDGGHSSGELTCGQNPRTKRYSRYYEPGDGTGTQWTVTLLNAYKINSSDTYLSCGRISMVAAGSLKTMAQNWEEPYNYSIDSLGSERFYGGGEVETTSSSDLFVRFGFQGAFSLTDSSINQHPLAYATLLRDQRLLHFENRSDDTNKVHAYMLRRSNEVSIVEEFPTIDFDVEMIEAI